MATKDFMSPKNNTPVTANNNDCGPKTYGAPASPGAAAAAAPASEQKKPVVNNTSSKPVSNNGSVAPVFVKPNNAYEHESGNVVANAEVSSTESPGNENTGDLDLNLQFQPNVLDNYDTVTYRFKLFITDPDTSSTGLVFNENNQIIIAETGVTDLTIDKVEIRTLATPSIEGGTGTSTNVKFEIVEPAGAGLIDKLFYQSVALGIGNWAVMPVYLQLQFRGRDPVNAAPENGAPGTLSSLKWLWSLKLSRIKANVTHVGTRYEFEAIVYNDFAQTNAIFSTQHNVVLSNLNTFADAMKELQDKLNADQIYKLINNYSIADSFKIVVDPKIAGYKITPANNNTNSRRSDSFAGDLKSATFQAGTGIDKIIDSLLAQTDEYQKSMLNAPTPGAEGESMNEESNQMKKFWRIITETRPLKFDARRQDISKEFTIFVVEYDIGILDQNVFQTSAPPLTIEAQKKRLMTYVKKSILKKKYNYIFTGLNDQVLNFDITINNAFANSQARFGGIYSNAAMFDKGVVNHNHAQEEARVTEILTNAISFQNSASTESREGAQAALDNARNSIESSNLPEDQKQRYLTILEKSKPESRLGWQREIQEAGGITNRGDLNRTRLEAKRLSTPIRDQITQKQLTFISDVKVNSADTRAAAYAQLMENSKGKLRPIARVETIQDKQIGMGIESNSNSGIQKLSTMFSVALHSGLDSSFQRIKLTIKGDPFWIAPQPYVNDTDRIFNSLKAVPFAIDWIKNAHLRASSPQSVNIFGTDNFFLIRFRTPQMFEGSALENNADENTDVETLSGVYKATVIISRFDTGKFTQELEAILDPELNVLNFSNLIEAEARRPDTASPSNLINRGRPLPETAKKKDRITGSVKNAGGKISQAVSDKTGQIKAIGTGTIDTLIPLKGPTLSGNIPIDLGNRLPGG